MLEKSIDLVLEKERRILKKMFKQKSKHEELASLYGKESFYDSLFVAGVVFCIVFLAASIMLSSSFGYQYEDAIVGWKIFGALIIVNGAFTGFLLSHCESQKRKAKFALPLFIAEHFTYNSVEYREYLKNTLEDNSAVAAEFQRVLDVERGRYDTSFMLPELSRQRELVEAPVAAEEETGKKRKRARGSRREHNEEVIFSGVDEQA